MEMAKKQNQLKININKHRVISGNQNHKTLVVIFRLTDASLEFGLFVISWLIVYGHEGVSHFPRTPYLTLLPSDFLQISI